MIKLPFFAGFEMSAENAESSSSKCAQKPRKQTQVIALFTILAIFNVFWGTGGSLAVNFILVKEFDALKIEKSLHTKHRP